MSNMQDKIEQGSPEWLAIRKKSVTATDLGVLMLENPFKTPYQLFEEKLGYRTVEENEAMREGTRLEPYARAKLQELFNVELNPIVCFHGDHHWQMASLDAADNKWQFVTEIKCSKKYHELAKAGTVPAHAQAQMQWQMHVTGVDNMFYYAFDGYDGILIPVKRDQVYINKAIEKAKEFYQCLQSLEPPALIARDIVKREDPEWFLYAQQWTEAKQQLAYWEEMEKRWRKQLIEMAGESCAEGACVKVTKYIRRGNVDYGAIPALKDMDLNEYRKPSTIAWRIT